MSEFVPDVQAALERLEALVGKYGSSFDQNAIGTLKAALSDVHIPGMVEVDVQTFYSTSPNERALVESGDGDGRYFAALTHAQPSATASLIGRRIRIVEDETDGAAVKANDEGLVAGVDSDGSLQVRMDRCNLTCVGHDGYRVNFCWFFSPDAIEILPAVSE